VGNEDYEIGYRNGQIDFLDKLARAVDRWRANPNFTRERGWTWLLRWLDEETP